MPSLYLLRKVASLPTLLQFLQTWNNLLHWLDFLTGSPGKLPQSAQGRTVWKSSPYASAFGTQFKEMPLSLSTSAVLEAAGYRGRKTWTVILALPPQTCRISLHFHLWKMNKKHYLKRLLWSLKVPNRQETFNDKHKHYPSQKEKKKKRNRYVFDTERGHYEYSPPNRRKIGTIL